MHNVSKIFDKRSRSIKSFVKRVHRDLYPRFHLYLEEQGHEWVFNLHLDQRATVYEGQTAHAGEYDGEVVEKEAQRIKNSIIN
jgi:CRISPR/Cas system CMR subunit Cmr6 (Cas7 group RAMP superfamily)